MQSLAYTAIICGVLVTSGIAIAQLTLFWLHRDYARQASIVHKAILDASSDPK